MSHFIKKMGLFIFTAIPTVALVSLCLFLSLPAFTFAQQQTYVPLVNLPDIDFTSPGSVVNGFVRLIFIVAALLAIGRIIWGGFLYLTTEAFSGKSEGKSIITDALIGLLLILVSVLILSIINPDILNIRLFNSTPTPLPPSSVQPNPPYVPPPQGTQGGGGTPVPTTDPNGQQVSRDRIVTRIIERQGGAVICPNVEHYHRTGIGGYECLGQSFNQDTHGCCRYELNQ